MQLRGFVARESNPADARSAVITLLAAGRHSVETAAGPHVANVRRHFIDLLTPVEQDTLAEINDRILRHFAAEPETQEPRG